MRRLRIAAPVQLGLALPDAGERPEAIWWTLPEAARAQALAVLARLIAKGVFDEGEESRP